MCGRTTFCIQTTVHMNTHEITLYLLVSMLDTVCLMSQNGVIYKAFDVIFCITFCFYFCSVNYFIIKFFGGDIVSLATEPNTPAIEACSLNGVKAVEIARLFGVSEMMF